MGKRSFRTSSKYEQLEGEILAHYGITGETQVQLYEKLMETLHERLSAIKAGTADTEFVTDLKIDCVHLVSYDVFSGTTTKDGEKRRKRTVYLCVWRPPSIDILLKDPTKGKSFVICKGSPVKTKVLPSLEVCRACQIQCPAAQAYREPMKEMDAEPEESELTELERKIERPQDTQASVKVVPATVQQPAEEVFIPVMHWIPQMRSDGSKMCPFTAEYVYVLKGCKDCKANHRKRFSACIDLFYQAQKEQKSKASSVTVTQKTEKW